MKLLIPKTINRMKRKIMGLLQIALSYVIVYWVFKGNTNLKIDRSGIRGLQPPFIVLGNHTSSLDPALVQVAIAHYPCYFLTTNYYFRHPVIGKLLRLLGAIPKIQFSPDIRSTRSALATLARGDIVGIFPEGRRSIDGSCYSISESMARFIKLAKVPVVSVKTNGGYFVWPRWSNFWRSGRIETVASQIFTTAEICRLDTQQIHALVCQAITYNEYDWNRDAKALYYHRKAAEQLQLILHQCPRCLGERKMKSKKTKLYCSACGNTAFLDDYGFLQPLNDECVVFNNPVQWTAWQNENMLARVRENSFDLQAIVTELRIADKYTGAYRSCGCGKIDLKQQGLYFYGKVDGQIADLFFPIKMLPTISTEFSYDFEISDAKNAWWFFLAEEQQTVRLESAIALLYQLSCQNVPSKKFRN
jgi:1-acyl-sn-glycerol-3-phosphate acyltransferase